MTLRKLIKLRDKVREKKAPRYSRFFLVSLGLDNYFYFDNYTKSVMEKTDSPDSEYWRKRKEQDWRNNSNVIDYDNCRWYIKSDLPEHMIERFVINYTKGLQSGNIRTYRLD